jgi:prepilin-type N-terminal cleavage/methylation domain-containing protein
MLTKFRNSAKGFTLIELMIVVAILAILSVVAVPAFIKYMRKAKTSEAIDMLDKIYKGASDYYATPRVVKHTASKLDCQFPATQAQTPIEGSCCTSQDTNNDDRCDAKPSNWNSNTWNALKFQITEEHYFVYSFYNNDQTGGAAQFTATANADLDCDGGFSTFQRYGLGDPQASDNECAIRGGAALYTEKETE